ncbi:MAG: ABC transporter ATP-binding protein [Candidatus Omnitrophota bacterium]
MIDARAVCKSFRGRVVLNRLDLKVARAETLVIIGRSGCGKSVFLKHAMGLIRPDSGQLWIDGVNIVALSGKEASHLRMRFGMLFQAAALFDSMSVGENVGFALYEHTNLSSKAIRQRIGESLDHVGLRGIEELRPCELSGGMKKRVALARAICLKPEILLYDEPTTGLDPITADAINNLIIELNDRLKITSLVVTHDMVSAYKIGTRIAMMYEGNIIESGTPDQIRQSINPVVQQFITGSAKGPITDRTPVTAAAVAATV